MGRRRKTEAERRAERFGECYRGGKSKLGLTEEQISEMIGIRRPALLARRKDPGKLSLNQLITLGKLFGWSESEYMAIIRPDK